MKTPALFFVGLTASVLLASGAWAQAPVVTPTTPAPAVSALSSPTSQPPAVDRIIYGQRLPTPEELTNVASAQGSTLEHLEQTSTQIIAVFRYANGQTNVVSYQVLPASGVALGQIAATTVVPVAPATRTTVVYETPREAVYYDPYYYWPGYAPVRVGIGLGLGFGYRGGGYYHGGGWYRGGGWYHGGHR